MVLAAAVFVPAAGLFFALLPILLGEIEPKAPPAALAKLVFPAMPVSAVRRFWERSLRSVFGRFLMKKGLLPSF